MKVLGIDEAGRGPIIGSMFMAGVLIEQEDEPKLKEWGVKDSKLLTPEKRKGLYHKIIAEFPYKIVRISAGQIDEVLSSESTSNLNWLEAKHQVEIVNHFDSDRAIIDCPSPNTTSYSAVLRAGLNNKKVELVVEHKADANYVCVGAASILAKVSRDREIEELHLQIGEDFGSGYLTDEKTVEFLKKNWKKHEGLFRKRWTPYKDLMAQSQQKSLSLFQ